MKVLNFYKIAKTFLRPNATIKKTDKFPSVSLNKVLLPISYVPHTIWWRQLRRHTGKSTRQHLLPNPSFPQTNSLTAQMNTDHFATSHRSAEIPNPSLKFPIHPLSNTVSCWPAQTWLSRLCWSPGLGPWSNTRVPRTQGSTTSKSKQTPALLQ